MLYVNRFPISYSPDTQMFRKTKWMQWRTAMRLMNIAEMGLTERCTRGPGECIHQWYRANLRVKFNSHSQQICSYTDAFPIEFECVIDAKGATSKWFDSKWVEPLLLLHFQWISKPSQMHKYNQWKSITKYIFDSCNSTEISSYFACNQFFPP